MKPLTTYTRSEESLSQEDARYVSDHLSEFVDIGRPAEGFSYFLNPGPNVFVIPLPSGEVLRSFPRLPVRNVMRMLTYAYDLPFAITDQEAPFDTFEGLLELLVLEFCRRVENRISSGLYRQYVDVEENLIALKGKVLFAQDSRQNVVLRHRTFCQYSDLQWDIPENQVIKYVARLLIGVGLSRDTEARLAAIDRILDEVQFRPFTSADVLQFNYHRLNFDYGQIHDLCRLLLDGYSVFEQHGAYLFHGFSLNMNDLFEAFIANALARRLRDGLRVGRHDSSWLGRRLVNGRLRRVLRLEPDILISKGPEDLAIADCKFKREPGSGDFYQVLAYCMNRSLRHGALIYPKSEFASGRGYDDTHLVPSEVVIRRLAIDLESPEIEGELDRLAAQVRDWIHTSGVTAVAS